MGHIFLIFKDFNAKKHHVRKNIRNFAAVYNY